MFELLREEGTITIKPKPGATILEALAGEPSIAVAAPCGGRGRCGKCVVRITAPSPAPEPSTPDLRFLSTKQLAEGLRLACTCSTDLVEAVEAPREYREASVKGDIPRFDEPAVPMPEAARAGVLAAAVDIGTTTVAVFLVDAVTGEPMDVISRMNRQSVYGADVLSRIAYADEKGGKALTEAIRAQIEHMLHELAGRNGYSASEIGTVVITGNTTMLHFLAGEDASGIGRAPFIPTFIEKREYPAAELDLELASEARVILLPSVSAYVGADIVSAAVAVSLDCYEETTLLVDIGTNGELALRHNGTVWACSTAAGPAFEGASISAGVAGIAGAIRTCTRDNGVFTFETIGSAAALGICGSGILDLLATLLDDGVVEETGRMTPADELAEATPAEISTAYAARLLEDSNGEAAFRLAGPYFFIQKDVREVQLAKAAIAAGIDTLLNEAQIAPEQLDRIVLTGGFGHHLEVSSAVRIGLLPDIERSRFHTISNGAGAGALMVLRQANTLERMRRFQSGVTYIELSGHPYFQERFIDHMTFPEEGTGNAKETVGGGEEE